MQFRTNRHDAMVLHLSSSSAGVCRDPDDGDHPAVSVMSTAQADQPQNKLGALEKALYQFQNCKPINGGGSSHVWHVLRVKVRVVTDLLVRVTKLHQCQHRRVSDEFRATAISFCLICGRRARVVVTVNWSLQLDSLKSFFWSR